MSGYARHLLVAALADTAPQSTVAFVFANTLYRCKSAKNTAFEIQYSTHFCSYDVFLCLKLGKTS